LLTENHPDYARSLNNLGVLLLALGEQATGREYLEQALEIFRLTLGNDHPTTANCLSYLGRLEVASGRFQEAIARMREALAIDDRMIGQVFSIGSDRQRLLFLRKLEGNREAFLSVVYRHLSHSPDAVRAAFDLVVRRKALAAEALAAQRD